MLYRYEIQPEFQQQLSTRVEILATFIFSNFLLTFIYKYVYSVQQRKKNNKKHTQQ